jgi:hypothetical protein
MTTERSRLLSIIEYAQQSARMKTLPVANAESHGLFSLWESGAQGRPGVLVNPDAMADNDERWLVIQRLQQSVPPVIKSAVLLPWLDLAQTPDTAPKLRQVVSGQSLIAAGTHRKVDHEWGLTNEQKMLPEVDLEATVNLDDYENAEQVRIQFAAYLAHQWNPWAEQEKAVRETISLYSKLFKLKQQLEDGVVEKALELVWGVGVGVWRSSGANVTYPLITRLVELSLNWSLDNFPQAPACLAAPVAHC